MEEIFDIFLRRNTWSSKATEKEVGRKYEFSKRIIKKDLVRINFDGKFDGKGKTYLVELFEKGYPVIPTVDKLSDINKLGDCEKYLLKLHECHCLFFCSKKSFFLLKY